MQAISTSLHQYCFSTKNLFLIQFYNLTAESIFRIVLLLKLRSGGLQRPDSTRLECPDIEIRNSPKHPNYSVPLPTIGTSISVNSETCQSAQPSLSKRPTGTNLTLRTQIHLGRGEYPGEPAPRRRSGDVHCLAAKKMEPLLDAAGLLWALC